MTSARFSLQIPLSPRQPAPSPSRGQSRPPQTLPLPLIGSISLNILPSALPSTLATPQHTTRFTARALVFPRLPRRNEPLATLTTSIVRNHAPSVDLTSGFGRILDSLTNPNPRPPGSPIARSVDHCLVTAEAGVLSFAGDYGRGRHTVDDGAASSAARGSCAAALRGGNRSANRG